MTEQQVSEVLSQVIRRKLKTDWNRPLEKQSAVRINTIDFLFQAPQSAASCGRWPASTTAVLGMSKP